MSSPRRLNVTLAPEYAAKLRSMAERTQVQEGTLVTWLLSSALDQADPDAVWITTLLDGTPGAFERMEAARAGAANGETIVPDDL